MPRPRWVGFRIEAQEYRAEPLQPLLARLRGRITDQRWFYLWHAEGGLHLRLRFRVRDTNEEQEMAATIARSLWELGLHAAVRNDHYLRSVYGFGETVESALAELLHEATSSLALHLLANVRCATSGQVWVTAACSVWIIARQSIPNHELSIYFDESLGFAGRVAQIGSSEAIVEIDRRYQAVQQSLVRFDAVLMNIPFARRSSTIVRHLWCRGTFGRFVAVHGIHLFCNELGLTIQREYVLLNVLRALYEDACNASPPLALDQA